MPFCWKPSFHLSVFFSVANANYLIPPVNSIRDLRTFTSSAHCRAVVDMSKRLLFIVHPVQRGLYPTVPYHSAATPGVCNGSLRPDAQR